MEIKTSKVSSNSRGFIVTMFLIIYPILFILSMFLVILCFLLQARNQAYWHCYKTGSQIQRELKENLQKLLSLNFKAESLRKEKKRSKELLNVAIMTGLLPLIKKAKMYVEIVSWKQKILRVKQLYIIKKSSLFIDKKWKDYLGKTSSFLISSKKMQNVTPLAVEFKPLFSASPSYYVKKPFSLNQKLKIQWKMDELYLLPSMFKKYSEKYLLFSKKTTKQCSVSLKQIGAQFQIIVMN